MIDERCYQCGRPPGPLFTGADDDELAALQKRVAELEGARDAAEEAGAKWVAEWLWRRANDYPGNVSNALISLSQQVREAWHASRASEPTDGESE